MGLQISTFPALPAHRQTVTLEGRQYRLRLTWRHRLTAWYLDLWTLDGTPLALGRRLSAGWAPTLGLVLEGGPDGLFLVRGSDGAAREDLGVSTRLLYYRRDELRAAQPTAEASSYPVVELG